MARRILGIKNHDKVSIETEKGKIILKPVPDILYYSGSAGKAYSVSEEKKALKAYVSVLAEEHECGEIATFNISDFKKLSVKLYQF